VVCNPGAIGNLGEDAPGPAKRAAEADESPDSSEVVPESQPEEEPPSMDVVSVDVSDSTGESHQGKQPVGMDDLFREEGNGGADRRDHGKGVRDADGDEDGEDEVPKSEDRASEGGQDSCSVFGDGLKGSAAASAREEEVEGKPSILFMDSLHCHRSDKIHTTLCR
jgi:hypothetical protein